MNWSTAKRRWTENWRVGAVGALVGVLVGLPLLFVDLGKPVVQFSYDLPYFFARNAAADEVAIIAMNENAAETLNLPLDERLWDRSFHARLLRQPCIQNARLVVFDIVFKDSTTNDLEFASALRKHGSVLLAAGQIVEKDIFGAVVNTSVPVDLLASNAAAYALVNLPQGTDDALRQHSSGEGLAWKAAELAGKHPPAPSANRWINYYGEFGSIPYDSVYSNAIDPWAFSNKVVFVGGKGQLITKSGNVKVDEHPTALTRWRKEGMSGVEIQATAFLNLVRGDWLTQSATWIEALLVLLTGLIFGFGLALLRPLPGALLAATGVVVLAGADLYFVAQHHYWFPWAVPGLVQIPLALGWSGLMHTHRLLREQEVLTTELAAVTAAPLSPGSETPSTVVVADHVLLARVGEGAYGEVWLARSLVGMYRAVKIIRRQKFTADAPYEREFRGIEKFMPISLNHPGLLRVLHVGRDKPERYFFYIMEAADDEVSGQRIDPNSYSPRSLHSVLKKRSRLPLAECLELGLSLSAALEYLHGQQLIHRDLKPANIIYVNGAAKIADIGLVTDLRSLRTSATCLGTPGYMAPEGPGAAVADLYSFGKLLYETFTGLVTNQFPELPSDMLAQPSDDGLIGMNRILLRACEADPRNRYQSAAEMHAALLSLKNCLQRAAEERWRIGLEREAE